MHCALCGAVSGVTDSRQDDSGGVRRRRRCVECGHRWTTLELPEEVVQVVNDIARIFTRAQPHGRKRSNRPQNNLQRSGYVVPSELEDDWLVLKKNHYTDHEAAESLKLPRSTRPEKPPRPRPSPQPNR